MLNGNHIDAYQNGQTEWYSNESYQRILADNLIKSLGRDNAIDACYDHDWMETLAIVKSRNSEDA